MRTIQSKQIAPIPNAREFDRIMANVGLTVEGLTSGSGGSGGGGTTVINNTTEVTNNYIIASDYVVRLVFTEGLAEDTVVYSGDVSCVQYVAIDGEVAEIGNRITAPAGTVYVDFLFNDPSFIIPNAKIPDEAFKQLVLEKVIIPSGIMVIGDGCFAKGNVRELIMQPVTPPLNSTEYTASDIRKFIVPDVAMDAYGKFYESLSEAMTPMSEYVSSII